MAVTSRHVELFCVLSVALAIVAGTVTLVFWHRDRVPDYSLWCDPSHKDFSVNITGAPMEDNTYNWTDGGITFPPGTFWTDSDGSIFGCPCSRKRCLRKCCKQNVKFDRFGECAIESSSSVVEAFIQNVHSNSDLSPRGVSDDYFYVLHGLTCSGNTTILDREDNPYLLDDGRVFTERSVATYLDQAHYCLEEFEEETDITIIECSDRRLNLNRWDDILKVCGMMVSIPFLLCTLLVYALVPSLRNLHGKSLMCHVSCLTVAYIASGITILQHESVHGTKEFCIVMAFITQFAFLATSFWLNVMSVDIWRIFSDLAAVRNSKSIATKRADERRFLMYSCYAWGGPVLISSVTAVMDFYPEIPGHYIRPQFYSLECWFNGADAQILYFYLPIGVLLCVNLMVFITTAYRLRVHTIKAKSLRIGSNQKERQMFGMFVKLFAVMGLNWVLEVISCIVEGEHKLWLVSDIANSLQGITIFCIFVCKRSTLNQLRDKFWPKKHRCNSLSSRTTRCSNICTQPPYPVSRFRADVALTCL